MLHVQQLPSMPSTLLSGYPPHHTDRHQLPHQLPQLREFTWDWDEVRSKAGKSAEPLPRPAGYPSQYVASSTPSKLHENTSQALIAPIGGQYMNPPGGPPPNAASLYPTPNVHARQGSNGRPFYTTYYSAQQKSPPAKKVSTGSEINRRRPSQDGNTIALELQIPPAINDSKGSLPEFAAQITCLFWFESSQTLQFAQQHFQANMIPSPLNVDAMPSTGFRKWVTTILSMTQVTNNVIILALLFIYRLKSMNPGVKGKVGSEFRLLTVALMLGNKFLDDNTYTNKTWAEVSGISVQEIHVMEVEFLSNMRYSLFVQVDEWDRWHEKLGRFSVYYDRATEEANRANISPFSRVPILPSPPNSVHTSPPLPRTSPGQSQPIMPPLLNQTNPSPMSLSHLDSDPLKIWGRKRSIEETQPDHPAKRMQPYAAPSSISHTLRESDSLIPRLPLPNIPSTSQQGSQNALATHLPMTDLQNTSQHGGYGGPGNHPPVPVTRAMASIYPAPTRWSNSGMQLPSLPTSQHFNTPSTTSDSPGTVLARPSHYGPTSGTSSPTSYAYPQPQGSTPTGLSPSGMPFARSSPYKPVRGVHTLLVPPPSAAVFHAPQQLSYEQMRYQSIGQPKNETRAGVLPQLPFDTWSASHQLQHYLPQPNFGP